MGTRETYRSTLMRACTLTGDATKLARKLQVPVPVLKKHLLGATPIPTSVFLMAVDLVLAAEQRLLLTEARASRAKSERRTARTR